MILLVGVCTHHKARQGMSPKGAILAFGKQGKSSLQTYTKLCDSLKMSQLEFLMHDMGSQLHHNGGLCGPCKMDDMWIINTFSLYSQWLAMYYPSTCYLPSSRQVLYVLTYMPQNDVGHIFQYLAIGVDYQALEKSIQYMHTILVAMLLL